MTQQIPQRAMSTENKAEPLVTDAGILTLCYIHSNDGYKVGDDVRIKYEAAIADLRARLEAMQKAGDAMQLFLAGVASTDDYDVPETDRNIAS